MMEAETENAEQVREMAVDFFRASAQHIAGAMWWAVVPTDRESVEWKGRAGTSDLALMFDAMCRDVQKNHTFGNCGHCDRLARAFEAARAAFYQTFTGQVSH
jgi:hypothetical protein